MSVESKKFASEVRDNKMYDAKKTFENKMKEKMSSIVTQMREDISKTFFVKK